MPISFCCIFEYPDRGLIPGSSIFDVIHICDRVLQYIPGTWSIRGSGVWLQISFIRGKPRQWPDACEVDNHSASLTNSIVMRAGWGCRNFIPYDTTHVLLNNAIQMLLYTFISKHGSQPDHILTTSSLHLSSPRSAAVV